MERKLSFFIVLLLLVLFLSAEATLQSNPFQDYIADQNITTFEQAFKYYSDELMQNPDDNNARIKLSYVYLMELKRALDQIDVYADSVKPNIQFNYANLLLEMGRFEEAIEVYEMLNIAYPNWSCPWRHKGEAYFKINNLSEAEGALKKAIETRVEHYDAYVILAEVQEAMDKYEEALITLETGLSYKGKDIENPDEEVSDLHIQFLYLRLLKANNKTKEADALQKKLMDSVPDAEYWKEM